MSESTDTDNKKLPAGYIGVSTAPVIFFDFAPTHGVFGGVVQVELAARALLPLVGGGVDMKVIEVARLRCTPTAAKFLKEALAAALNMLEKPQATPPEVGNLN
jgi:hypothetical protein